MQTSLLSFFKKTPKGSPKASPKTPLGAIQQKGNGDQSDSPRNKPNSHEQKYPTGVYFLFFRYE